jgi:chromosome segregation ATPase
MWLRNLFPIGWFILVLFCVSPVWSQPSYSIKTTVTDLLLKQRTALLQCEKNISDYKQAIANLEQQLSDTNKNDEQRTNELLKQLDERKILFNQLQTEYGSLSNSIRQLEKQSEDFRIERDAAIGTAATLLIVWLVREAGHALGWW